MFKTRFISMLVLLAAVATGAWAQDPNAVTAAEINSDLYSGWTSDDGKLFKASELPGFQAVTEDQAKSWTGVPSTGNVDLYYEFVADGHVKYVRFENGVYEGSYEDNELERYFIYEDIAYDGSTKYFYTTGPAPEPATVAVTGVTLAPTSATLTLGETETVTLIPTVLPAEATDKSVTWSSSDEAVATVTDGVVTAVAAGTATITVTTTDGAKTATCAVTVAAPAASTYTVTLKEGTDDATSWTIAPAEATTTGVAAGTTVTATYNGMKKVKSVKAVKKAAAAPALNLTSPAVGQVIGDDGKNYAAGSVPTGVTAVAMIAYLSGSNGLAIALAVEGSLNWETAKSTCEAKTPAFTNGTWKLPSQEEWKQMFSANGGSDESYTGLNTAITNAGGTAFRDDIDDYWTSTPYSDDKAYHVYLFGGGPRWFNDAKGTNYLARAVLAF